MKKILLLVIAFALFYLPKNVNALQEQIYGGEKIDNMWIKKVKGEKIEYHQAAVIRRRSDNNYVYCVEPWSVISEDATYTDIIDANSLDDDIMRKISTAAYYGYGYGHHGDIKWYYITQVAIWKIIDPNADFYFTDSLNGNKINTYDNQITEILNLVSFHNRVPDFTTSEINIPIGGIVNVMDKNEVTIYYQMTKDNGCAEISRSDNKLTITAEKIGETTVFFKQITNRFNSNALLYRHSKHQNFLSAGNIKPLASSLKINVIGGSIKINKLDLDTNSTIPSGDASLKESTFGLYNRNMDLVAEKTTVNNELVFNNLPLRKYYLKEIKAGNGYQLNTEIKEINLTEDNYEVTIDFYNKVIESDITIQKYYGKNEQWQKEENAEFEIYDSKNQLIRTVKTNKDGIIKITLPYGFYTFLQKSGKENYELCKPFNIEVNEKSKNITITKHNEEITGNLTILKIDSNTNTPVKNNYASFKIFNYTTNEWLPNEYKTNESGILNIKNLSIGKYKIVEIKAPDGYEISNDEYIIEIKKDNLNIILEIPNDIIYEIPNTAISIEPIKIDEIIYEYKKKYFITNNNIINIQH